MRDCAMNAIGDTIVTSVGEIDTAIRHYDSWIRGELIVHYEVLGDSRMRLQVGRSAVKMEASELSSGLIEFTRPAGPIASHLHKGSYMGIFPATMRLMDACRTSGHEIIGDSWEIYHHNTEPLDPTTSETTIYFRIKGH